MNSIFSYSDYIDYLKAYIKNQPKSGRGFIQRLADHLRVTSTFVSQVLGGHKNFAPEQGIEVAEYIGLVGLEKEFFISLIQLRKSGSKKLEDFYKDQVEMLRRKSRNLGNRVKTDRTLSESQQAIFYSSWLYAAISVYTTFPKGVTIEQVCEEFQISRGRSLEILSFLTESGLCVHTGPFYKAGPTATHLEQDSPLRSRHLMLWRNRALQRLDNVSEKELVYSAPIAISDSDFSVLRDQMANWIKKMSETVQKSQSEKLAFINIDLMMMKPD